MTRTPNLPLAFALGGLAALALALTAYRWTTDHELSVPALGVAILLLVALAILPTATGRPIVDPTLLLCQKCGAASPSHAAAFCLMCGAFPRVPRPN
ncbi:MAG TPA: hypothetical protein VM327_01710 [Candidatus Thermoplasmatota archaeon]|nr:hypothetical protein [Candidatus Thermoplasmatota archaeon]